MGQPVPATQQAQAGQPAAPDQVAGRLAGVFGEMAPLVEGLEFTPTPPKGPAVAPAAPGRPRDASRSTAGAAGSGRTAETGPGNPGSDRTDGRRRGGSDRRGDEAVSGGKGADEHRGRRRMDREAPAADPPRTGPASAHPTRGAFRRQPRTGRAGHDDRHGDGPERGQSDPVGDHAERQRAAYGRPAGRAARRTDQRPDQHRAALRHTAADDAPGPRGDPVRGWRRRPASRAALDGPRDGRIAEADERPAGRRHRRAVGQQLGRGHAEGPVPARPSASRARSATSSAICAASRLGTLRPGSASSSSSSSPASRSPAA